VQDIPLTLFTLFLIQRDIFALRELMTKRIAIQLFGHLRSFQKTQSSLKKNIIFPCEKSGGYAVDVFIHTWDELEHTDMRTHYRVDKRTKGKPLTDAYIRLMMKNYAPKAFLVEKQLQLTDEEKEVSQKNGILDKRSKNMAYTFYASNWLRAEYEQTNGMCYDLVCVTRPDIIFYKPLDLFSIFRDFGEKEMHDICFFCDIPMLDKPERCINSKKFIRGIDLFLLADRNSVSKIASEWYEKKRYLINSNAERNIAQIIHENNIYLNLIQFPKHYCWNIKRTNECQDKWFVIPVFRLFDWIVSQLDWFLIYSPYYQKMTFRGRYHALDSSKKLFGKLLKPFSFLFSSKLLFEIKKGVRKIYRFFLF